MTSQEVFSLDLAEPLFQVFFGVAKVSLPLLILILAIVFRSKSTKASNLMIVTALLIFLEFVLSIAGNLYIAQRFEVGDFRMYYFLLNSVTIAIHSVAVLLLAIAAVCERQLLGKTSETDPGTKADGSLNPFRTPSNP